MTSTTTYRTAHRGAGPRADHRRRMIARLGTTATGTRYAVGPLVAPLRRAATGITTLAVVLAVLLILATVGRSDFRRECQDVMRGSDDMVSAQTCIASFGPRGF